ncbi:LysR substrate-binding domain-containing protein [Celeribacter sp.]|uniref:LysR substrate-binding domain-containing protein n=1 Tax=Celeribacter sp. TaxID=1890673 RepID=UPI003A8F4585
MERLLARGLKMNHLRLAAALSREEKLSDAALRLGLAQPAASRLASEIHQILGTPLFERHGRGIKLTEAGRAFAARAQRILNEIDDADREVSEIASGVHGTVRIGSVTGPAIEMVIPAVRTARELSEGIRVDVEVATSNQLGPMVRNGALDFALGRLPADELSRNLTYCSLAKEPVSFIVGKDHPLAKIEGKVENADLFEWKWILPPQNSILARTIDGAFRDMGLPQPDRLVSTSSALMSLAFAGETDSIAAVARPVAEHFAARGQVHILRTRFSISVEEFGIITRADAQLPPAAQMICDLVKRHKTKKWAGQEKRANAMRMAL